MNANITSSGGGVINGITNSTAKAVSNSIRPVTSSTIGNAPSNNYDTGNNSIDTLLQLQREANQINLNSAKETNEFNAREAQKNRDWLEYMSNTAHQREVDDLIKAGLNPILSAMGGNGASTPSGYAAHGEQGRVESGISAIASIIGASINASTQLQIAKLNSATSIANQNSYIKALQSNALLSSDTSKEVAKMTGENVTQNTLIGSGLSGLSHILSGIIGITGYKGLKKFSKDYNSKGEYWPGGEDYWISHGLK